MKESILDLKIKLYLAILSANPEFHTDDDMRLLRLLARDCGIIKNRNKNKK